MDSMPLHVRAEPRFSPELSLCSQTGSLLINEADCFSTSNSFDYSTSKNTDFSFTGINDMPTLTLSFPRDRSTTAYPARTGSSQGNAAVSNGTPESGEGTDTLDQGLSLALQRTSEILPSTAGAGSTGDEESIGAGGTITQTPNVGGGHTPQSTQTVAPDDSYATIDVDWVIVNSDLL